MGRPRRRGRDKGRDRSTRKRRAGGLRGAGPPGSGASRGGSRRGVTITSVGPTGTIRSPTPTVRATVQHSETTLSRSDTHVYLDGEEVTNYNYQRSTGSLSFRVRRGLSEDAHTVEIEASVGEGTKTARKRWTFSVQ
jgi:hypothetical protein